MESPQKSPRGVGEMYPQADMYLRALGEATNERDNAQKRSGEIQKIFDQGGKLTMEERNRLFNEKREEDRKYRNARALVECMEANPEKFDECKSKVVH